MYHDNKFDPSLFYRTIKMASLYFSLVFKYNCWTFALVIQMATAAPSPLASSVEKTNGAKLSRLLIDGGTAVLRKVFDHHHPPASLVADLKANEPELLDLFKKKVLHKPQWEQLFPPGGAAPDSNTFDITLLFLLLTNICRLSPPLSGWHAKPPPSDTSHEAHLAKFHRNVLYGHVSTTGVDTPTFCALWQDISVVLVALGLDQAEIDRLKAEKGGEEDCLDALLEWAVSEEDIKSQLKNICQSQSKTQQTVEEPRQTQTKTRQSVEDVLQTQTNTQQTVEDVRQTQTKTQQTVEEVRQTQAKTQQSVEDVRQTQTKILQTVEDVLQTQTKTQETVEDVLQRATSGESTSVEDVLQTQTKIQQTVEDVAAGLQEVKEAVDSLKQRSDKDKTDKVLRNLAKSEFRGDIEYYVERFQQDTREWVFNKVQNWLDDRSSQNRVMVMSTAASFCPFTVTVGSW